MPNFSQFINIHFSEASDKKDEEAKEKVAVRKSGLAVKVCPCG